MIKRIAILFSLTGFGHVFSIMALKLIAQRGLTFQVAGMGEAESLIQFMIGLIGFGMQSDAIRNITLNENWKDKLEQAQRARITLAIILMVLSVLSFSKGIYLCFLIAPLLASSSDYALYARGFPITGAMVAFARVVTPLLMSILSIYFWPQHVLVIYVLATTLTYFATNLFISSFLGVSIFYRPTLSSLLLYLKTLPLGIVNLCFYFFGLGILLLAQITFDEQALVISFLALKFYTVFKGAIRVIQQAFLSHMTDDKVCLSVDQISMLLGLAFLGSVLIFPDSFISVFFGKQFVDDRFFFTLLALSSIAFSIFCSSASRAVLDHRDIRLMWATMISVAISAVLLLTLAQFSLKVEWITLSLLAGEFFLAVLVAFSFFSWQSIWSRISYLVLCSTALALPLLIKWIFGENLISYVTGFCTMGLVLLFFSYKNFTLPVKFEKES